MEKWNTDNVISIESSVENQGIEGLKLTLDGSFNPSSGYGICEESSYDFLHSSLTVVYEYIL